MQKTQTIFELASKRSFFRLIRSALSARVALIFLTATAFLLSGMTCNINNSRYRMIWDCNYWSNDWIDMFKGSRLIEFSGFCTKIWWGARNLQTPRSSMHSAHGNYRALREFCDFLAFLISSFYFICLSLPRYLQRQEEIESLCNIASRENVRSRSVKQSHHDL